MKYDETFEEPLQFTDGTFVFHGEWTREQCLDYTQCQLGESDKTKLKRGLVRFGFPPAFVEDHDELGACWYTGASEGRGAKKVWIYE